MEKILELLEPKTFNIFHFGAMFIWTIISVTFLAVFKDIESNELRYDFRCGGAKIADVDFVRGKCYDNYLKQYNKFGFPVYGFVLLYLAIIAFVCVIYTFIARSKISQPSQGISIGDQERQLLDQETALLTGRKLFSAYISQLSIRVVLGVAFLLVQTQLLYPLKFPSTFDCYLTNGTTQPRDSNQTFTLHDCLNQRAKYKTNWMYVVFVVNATLVTGIGVETIYLFTQAFTERSFMQDSIFLKAHLGYKPYRKRKFKKFVKHTKKIIDQETQELLELQSPFLGDPGDDTTAKHLTLDQIYRNCVVIQNRETYDFPKNREEQLKVYRRSHLQPKSREDLLNVENKKVLIVGRPGIGKTLYCIKLLRDWALDKVFKGTPGAKVHFYVAFLIKCRRFNSADELSLRELFMRSEYFPKHHMDDMLWYHLQENPEGVLILFDGFDEYKHDENTAEGPIYPKSIEDKKPLQILYQWLVTGKLLKGVSVLTTTRSTALSDLRHLSFDKMYEILGFSSEQVEQYIYKLTGEEEEAGKKLWRHINSNMNLLSLCYVPVNSFIMCTSLLQVLQFDSATVTLPSELTRIYKIAVKVFYVKRTEEFRDKNFVREYFESDELPEIVVKKFEKLGRVAFKGIKEGKLILGGNEVRGMEDSALFHRLPDRQTDLLKHEKQFCFIHLTMQEFFAARYLTNMSETELRNFVSENIKNGKWQLVFQFLAGLMEDKSHLPSEIITDLLPVETEEIESADYNEKWTENDEKRKVTSWPTRDERDLAVTLIKCINENSRMKVEAQRKLKQTNLNLVNLISCHLTALDCSSLVNVIENVQQISHLDLSHNNIGPLGCFEICKLLKCRESQLSWLNLTGNRLIAEGAEYLTEAINSNNCQLRMLDLRRNNISNIGAQLLAEAINNNCQLHTLNLSSNKISDIGAQHMAIAINNSQLRKLDLSMNNISDTGAQYLTEAISNNCQLRTLDLSVNNISNIGAKDLAKAINNNNCQLRTLKLSYNHNITIIGKQDAHNSLSNGQSNCKLYV